MTDRVVDAVLGAVARLRSGGVIVNNHTQSAAEVRLQVETIGRHFDFVSHDEMLVRLDRPAAKPFCVMTFDDGKRIAFEEAAPVLERMGVPAAFYVVTDFVSGDRPLWFDVCPEAELSVLKRLPHAERMTRIERYAPSVAVDGSDARVAPMSWDQVRSLSRRGFTIGSHSTRHAILTCEDPAEARDDIRRSLERVTSETGIPCPSFAFPNGNWTPALAAHAVACGARSCMTTVPAWASPAFAPSALPRVQMHGYYDARRIGLKVLAASVPGLLANPDGTGRAYARSPRATPETTGQAVSGVRRT